MIPEGGSEVLALPGGRRLKATRAELFDRGFPRGFLLLEELTEELRASEKAAYGKLIRMMSHGIYISVGAVGSLLDSFRGYADELKGEDRDDFVQAIAVAITRLENLRAFMNGFAEVVRLPEPDRRLCDATSQRLVDEILDPAPPGARPASHSWSSGSAPRPLAAGIDPSTATRSSRC